MHFPIFSEIPSFVSIHKQNNSFQINILLLNLLLKVVQFGLFINYQIVIGLSIVGALNVTKSHGSKSLNIILVVIKKKT